MNVEEIRSRADASRKEAKKVDFKVTFAVDTAPETLVFFKHAYVDINDLLGALGAAEAARDDAIRVLKLVRIGGGLNPTGLAAVRAFLASLDTP